VSEVGRCGGEAQSVNWSVSVFVVVAVVSYDDDDDDEKLGRTNE